MFNYEEELEFDFSMIRRDLKFEIEYRNKIISSICPEIFEKYDIKFIIILCVIGGVTST